VGFRFRPWTLVTVAGQKASSFLPSQLFTRNVSQPRCATASAPPTSQRLRDRRRPRDGPADIEACAPLVGIAENRRIGRRVARPISEPGARGPSRPAGQRAERAGLVPGVWRRWVATGSDGDAVVSTGDTGLRGLKRDSEDWPYFTNTTPVGSYADNPGRVSLATIPIPSACTPLPVAPAGSRTLIWTTPVESPGADPRYRTSLQPTQA
jgi:hypothetical protein